MRTNKVKSIRDSVGTPSVALTMMCDRLEKESDREDFTVDMMTYGKVVGKTCFGCAATCAVAEATGIDITTNTVHSIGISSIDGFDYFEIRSFEQAIDRARRGLLRELFEFFGLLYHGSQYDCHWFMRTSNWRDEIPKVRKTIEEMRKERNA